MWERVAGLSGRGALMGVLVGILSVSGGGAGEAKAQFQAYGTDPVAAYTGGSWASQFGVVGGPIVTVNGYLYPFYSPFDLNRLEPTALINGGPVLSDWRTGYGRLDPSFLYQSAPFGYGYGSWGRSRFVPPVLPMVAGPPVPEGFASGVPAGAGGKMVEVPRQPPRLIRVDEKPRETVAPEGSPRGPRVIEPGRVQAEPGVEARPHLIILGQPPK